MKQGSRQIIHLDPGPTSFVWRLWAAVSLPVELLVFMFRGHLTVGRWFPPATMEIHPAPPETFDPGAPTARLIGNMIDRTALGQRCKRCGCTDERGCPPNDKGQSCYWMARNVCSRCACLQCGGKGRPFLEDGDDELCEECNGLGYIVDMRAIHGSRDEQ